MPHNTSLAAYLATAPATTGPVNFIGLVEQWLLSQAGSLTLTPEAKLAIKKTVMDIYDAVTASFSKTNVALGMLFGAFRPAASDLVDALLNQFSPKPSPITVPEPTPVPVIQGSTP